MAQIDRRDFLKAGVLAGAGLGMGLLGSDSLRAVPAPSMSVAHYRSSPTEPDGIAEEARRLTRQAIEALGGMNRFVSKANIVWVKPDIGWDRRPEQAATTNPDVVATIVSLWQDLILKSYL